MAIPVVSSTQSSLALAVGQSFEFKFYATNTPTLWNIANNDILPFGFVLNPYTGVLSGAGTCAGVWTINVKAKNSDGYSTSVPFNIGVFEVPTNEVVKIATINTSTWAVTLADSGTSTTGIAPAGYVRYGDDIVWKLEFSSGSLPLVSARLSIKGRDTENPFIVTDASAHKKTIKLVGGAFVRTDYLYSGIESEDLLSYLSENESDDGTSNNTLCEFEFLFEKPLNAVGPSTTKITTKPFILNVYRDTIR